MPKIPVDFSKVSSFEPAPSGIYNLRVMKVEEKTKKDGSGTYLNLEFKIDDGEFANKRIWMACSLAPGDDGFPKGMWIMKALCEACDMPLDLSELDTDDWIGCVVQAEVEKKLNDYTNTEGNNIKKFLA